MEDSYKRPRLNIEYDYWEWFEPKDGVIEDEGIRNLRADVGLVMLATFHLIIYYFPGELSQG